MMMTLKEKIAVMQAFEDGKLVQATPNDSFSEWHDSQFPAWDWFRYDYRVKPKRLEYWGIISLATDECPRVFRTLQEAKENVLEYDSDYINIVKLVYEEK